MNELESYILSHIDPEPEWLRQIDRDAHVNLLRGNMSSGHLQGRFLKMITRMVRAKRVLEIGSFVGYSALCLAEGLDADGEVHTIEADDELEDRLRANFARTDIGRKVFLHIGDALDVIPQFPDNSFELAFIDGEKEQYARYYERILPKMKTGGVVLADNTLWYGKVCDTEKYHDRATRAILEFNRSLAVDDRVEKVILPLRDGLTLIRKK